MKRVYYYLRKYPEYGIKDFEIKDVIEMEYKDEDKWISVYQPYEDEDILVHDKSHTLYGFDYILSFDKEKNNQTI